MCSLFMVRYLCTIRMRDSLFCVSAIFNASVVETLQFLLNSKTMILKKQSLQWLIFFLMSKVSWVFASGIQLFWFLFLLVSWIWCLCNYWLYLLREARWAQVQALLYDELQLLNNCRLPVLNQIPYSHFRAWSERQCGCHQRIKTIYLLEEGSLTSLNWATFHHSVSGLGNIILLSEISHLGTKVRSELQ